MGLLLKGASVAGACAQIGVSVWVGLRAIASDAELAERVRQVNGVLSQNVAAALYRAAMEGNVSAQTFWLKSCPPPGWVNEAEMRAEAQTFDEVLNGLTDEELFELARAVGVGLPGEGEAGVDVAGDAAEPGSVS